MRLLLSSLACAIILSACGGPSLSPEQKAQRATNIARTKAALEVAEMTTVNGKTFRVATIKEKNYALVELQSSSAPYTVADVEAAGARITGCKATFNAGVLAFLTGDIRTVDLNDLRSKIKSEFNGWSVQLKC